MRTKLQDIKVELQRRMHWPIPEQGEWLRQVVTGHFAYYAVPTNIRALAAFRLCVTNLWRRTLERRGQRSRLVWERTAKLSDDWLPILASFIRGRTGASPSPTRGRSHMRESRPCGSERGAPSNGRPYRESSLASSRARKEQNTWPRMAMSLLW